MYMEIHIILARNQIVDYSFILLCFPSFLDAVQLILRPCEWLALLGRLPRLIV
jgi:hypothetical protein